MRHLSERESGTAQLSQAVTALREALKELTRERVPLSWAITQNNLGLALQSLGERNSGTEQLSQAVTAYKAALEVFVQGKATRYEVMTRQNLEQVNALIALRAARPGV